MGNKYPETMYRRREEIMYHVFLFLGNIYAMALMLLGLYSNHNQSFMMFYIQMFLGLVNALSAAWQLHEMIIYYRRL